MGYCCERRAYTREQTPSQIGETPSKIGETPSQIGRYRMIESQPLALRAVSVADLFCGAGGSSTGLARACADLGVPYNLTAVNHWDVAIASHMANHPSANHLLAEVDKLRSGALSKHGRLDILWASPSCFVAGTLILTARGLVPIEEIVVGDSVLTHLGRRRSVTTTMQVWCHGIITSAISVGRMTT
jgi:hypothetical protein